MSGTCIYNPPEYADLLSAMITDKSVVIQALVNNSKIGFYDTCAIMHHCSFSDPSLLSMYFRDRFDLLVLTRTVIMELSTSPSVVNSVTTYLKQLKNDGVLIVVFDEEWILDVLKEDYTHTDAEFNEKLKYGLKSTSFIPTIRCGVKCLDSYMSSLKNRSEITNPNFCTEVFLHFRSRKVSEDGLAENLIMLLTNFWCSCENAKKFAIITNDRAMRINLFKVRENLIKVFDLHQPNLITTSTIMCFMYRKNFCNDTNKLKELGLTSKNSPNEIFNYAVLIEHAGHVRIERDGKISDLIDDIVNPDVIRILD